MESLPETRVQSKMDFTEICPTSFYGKRFETLAAASDAIEKARTNTSEVDLVIIPPNVDYQTDEEEFDDDNLIAIELPKDIPGELEVDVNEPEESNNLQYDTGSEDEDKERQKKIQRKNKK
ncbi:hypothetical protein FQR65_LT04700 [Abscondita terminalis]|nr:hypothetical protein FQR65_LT04700 [Abscondita terminalis]